MVSAEESALYIIRYSEGKYGIGMQFWPNIELHTVFILQIICWGKNASTNKLTKIQQVDITVNNLDSEI